MAWYDCVWSNLCAEASFTGRPLRKCRACHQTVRGQCHINPVKQTR